MVRKQTDVTNDRMVTMRSKRRRKGRGMKEPPPVGTFKRRTLKDGLRKQGSSLQNDEMMKRMSREYGSKLAKIGSQYNLGGSSQYAGQLPLSRSNLAMRERLGFGDGKSAKTRHLEQVAKRFNELKILQRRAVPPVSQRGPQTLLGNVNVIPSIPRPRRPPPRPPNYRQEENRRIMSLYNTNTEEEEKEERLNFKIVLINKMNSVNPGYIPTQMPPLGFGQLTNLSQYQEWELRSRRREADRKIVDAYNQMEGATGGVIGTANPNFSAAMQPGEIPSGGVQPTSDSSKAAIDGSRYTQAVQPNAPPKPSGVAGADPDLMDFPDEDFLTSNDPSSMAGPSAPVQEFTSNDDQDDKLDKFNGAFADVSQRWGMDEDSDISGISDASTASNPFNQTYDELMKKYEDGHDEIFGNATAHLGGLGGSWL